MEGTMSLDFDNILPFVYFGQLGQKIKYVSSSTSKNCYAGYIFFFFKSVILSIEKWQCAIFSSTKQEDKHTQTLYRWGSLGPLGI